MSGIQSFRSVKISQLCLHLTNILIKRKERKRNIKMKTVLKLAIITGINWWLTIYESELIHQKKKVRKEYYKLKEKSANTRQTYIEDMAKEDNQKGTSLGREETSHPPHD